MCKFTTEIRIVPANVESRQNCITFIEGVHIMPTRVGNITFDCDDALVVGDFWSRVIGRPLDPGGSSGFCSIGTHDPAREQSAWLFERVPEAKTAKNRVHLDLLDPDPAAVDRLVEMGASVVAHHEVSGGSHGWTVLHDPEGNEFCISTDSYLG
jgi:hypothetical protein